MEARIAASLALKLIGIPLLISSDGIVNIWNKLRKVT